ncbi:Uncharacterised protein [Mycobacteroides abscessus subsp. abscessus]|nr:Uncharacterised protein [Mycobacteroides abscessus subsp. abscessus]
MRTSAATWRPTPSLRTVASSRPVASRSDSMLPVSGIGMASSDHVVSVSTNRSSSVDQRR